MNTTRESLGSGQGCSIFSLFRSGTVTGHGWKSRELAWNSGYIIAGSARDARRDAFRPQVEFRGQPSIWLPSSARAFSGNHEGAILAEAAYRQNDQYPAWFNCGSAKS